MNAFLTKIKNTLLVVLLLTLFACGNISIWFVNSLTSFSDYQLIEEVTYAKDDLNTLDIYLPTKEDKKIKPLATVIFIYGGCWGGCETLTKENYRFVAESLTQAGYLVVIPDYRIYPEVRFPEIINDVSQTVTWVNQNIANYAGDKDNVFLMGHSSGAHIGAMLTLNESYLSGKSYQSIRGFIGLAGPYDFEFDKPYQFEVFNAFKQQAEAMPSYYVDGNEPPLLLLYGRKDTTVFLRNIVKLTQKINAKKGRVKSLYYDDIDHVGIISAFSIPLRNQSNIHKDVIEFLSLHQKQSSSTRLLK